MAIAQAITSRETLTGWWVLLLALLAAQITMRMADAPARPAPSALPAPPGWASARLLAFGDPVLFAKFTMLRLQVFDSRAGGDIAWRELDYGRVAEWLRLCLKLDPRAQYPLLAAARLYGEVRDPARVRQMIDLVAEEFAFDPARRWPWLAHAVFLARHRLHDAELALQLSHRLANTSAAIPPWARQLELLVLEDLGELETAKVMVGGLLANGAVTDPHELRFLQEFLRRLEHAEKQ